MKILIGSNNKKKIAEISAIFQNAFGDKVEFCLPNEVFENAPDPEETGATLDENAVIKAKCFHELSGLPCVADDTGLEIDALGGAPGVISARFAGEHGDDQANRTKVLELMSETSESQRNAHFRSVFCFADGDTMFTVDGIIEGKIIDHERGSGGFGYDSIFVPNGYTETFAELSAEVKNSISHRSRAIAALVAKLKEMDIVK